MDSSAPIGLSAVQSVSPQQSVGPTHASELARSISLVESLEAAATEALDKTLTPDGMTTAALVGLQGRLTHLDSWVLTLSNLLAAQRKAREGALANFGPR